mgnify:CR=1 FL=1
MNSIVEGAITIALMIGGIALAAVLVSRNANTTGVVQSLTSGFGNDIAVAQSPVSGANVQVDLSYPSNSDFGHSFGT